MMKSWQVPQNHKTQKNNRMFLFINCLTPPLKYCFFGCKLLNMTITLQQTEKRKFIILCSIVIKHSFLLLTIGKSFSPVCSVDGIFLLHHLEPPGSVRTRHAGQAETNPTHQGGRTGDFTWSNPLFKVLLQAVSKTTGIFKFYLA